MRVAVTCYNHYGGTALMWMSRGLGAERWDTGTVALPGITEEDDLDNVESVHVRACWEPMSASMRGRRRPRTWGLKLMTPRKGWISLTIVGCRDSGGWQQHRNPVAWYAFGSDVVAYRISTEVLGEGTFGGRCYGGCWEGWWGGWWGLLGTNWILGVAETSRRSFGGQRAWPATDQYWAQELVNLPMYKKWIVFYPHEATTPIYAALFIRVKNHNVFHFIPS